MAETTMSQGLIRGARIMGDSVVLGLRRSDLPVLDRHIAEFQPAPEYEDLAGLAVPKGEDDLEAEPGIAMFSQSVESVHPDFEEAEFAEGIAAAPQPASLSREDIEAERQALFGEARRKGREEGLIEARLELETQREADAGKVLRLLEAVPRALDQKLAEMEDEVADLVFASVCKMLGTAMQERTLALSAVRQVLALVKSARKVRVGLSPGDLDTLSSHLDIPALLPAGVALVVEADTTVRLGGCVISTDAGEWDGRLETQLTRLHEILHAAKSGPAEEPGA